MKKIETDIVITGIRAKVDGSLGFAASTPELSAEEKVAFMELQGVALKALFVPIDEPNAPTAVVDKEINTKTAGQRLRSVLYVLYTQSHDPKSAEFNFEAFYNTQMEKIINAYKDKLD